METEDQLQEKPDSRKGNKTDLLNFLKKFYMGKIEGATDLEDLFAIISTCNENMATALSLSVHLPD